MQQWGKQNMSYTKNNWTTGDTITAEKLNHMENGIESASSGGGGSASLTTEIKEALLDLFENVAYTTNEGRTYCNALHDALYPRNLVSISAVFTQGGNTIYDTDFLDDLKQYLVVTAHYDDDSSDTVTSYTLSGYLIAGTSTITVTYQDKTTTFDVNVTHAIGSCSIANSLIGCTTTNNATSVTEGDAYSATITASAGYTLAGAQVEITMNEVDITSSVYSNGAISIAEVTGNLIITVTAQAVALSSISAVYTQTEAVYTTDNLNSLKNSLVVTAHYSDGSEAEIAAANYTLSGTLSVGTSTITVTYSEQTTTFAVTVTEPVTLSSISAVYTQSGTVYEDDTLTSLKANLVVTATYSDTSTTIVPSTDYTLNGTLAEGTSTITVTYQNKTTTFNVTVTAAEVWEYKWVASESSHTAPTGMTTYGTPTWGANDEYIQVKDPKLQGATQTSLIGDMVVEVEMKWVEQGSASAGSTIVASSAEKTGCKLYLANNSGNVTMYSADEGGSYSSKIIGTDWDNFHKYRFELVGTLCKTYIDGALVDTGYTYYSSWNGYPIIWSENQTSGRSHWAIKSIKYRSANFKTLVSIDATYTQTNNVYTTDSIDDLKSDLVVTATYDDSSTATLTSNDYTLSGTLTEGTPTITATYEGKTDTFTPTVYDSQLITGLTWAKGYIDENGDLSTESMEVGTWTCKSHFVYDYTNIHTTLDGATSISTSFYDDDYQFISTTESGDASIPSNARYARETIIKSSLSGDTYDGTGTEIMLSQEKFVSSISASFTQGALDIYTETDLNVIRTNTTVTATYSDNTTNSINGYELSGTLAAGTSTITVGFKGKSDTISVAVTAMPTVPSGYTRYDYIQKKNTTTSKVAVGNFIYLPAATDYNLLSLECQLGMKSIPSSGTGGQEGLFGSRAANGDGVPYYGVYWQKDGTLSVAARDKWTTFAIAAGTLKTRLIIDNPATSPFYVYANEATINGRPYQWTDSPVLNYTMNLFNNIPSGTSTTMNINYLLRIGDMIFRDSTGACVAYYVPVIDSNNKIGMYDLINGTFSTAATAAAVTTTNSGCYYSVDNWS